MLRILPEYLPFVRDKRFRAVEPLSVFRMLLPCHSNNPTCYFDQKNASRHYSKSLTVACQLAWNVNLNTFHEFDSLTNNMITTAAYVSFTSGEKRRFLSNNWRFGILFVCCCCPSSLCPTLHSSHYLFEIWDVNYLTRSTLCDDVHSQKNLRFVKPTIF